MQIHLGAVPPGKLVSYLACTHDNEQVQVAVVLTPTLSWTITVASCNSKKTY